MPDSWTREGKSTICRDFLGASDLAATADHSTGEQPPWPQETPRPQRGWPPQRPTAALEILSS